MKPIVRALAGSLLMIAAVSTPALAQYPPDEPSAGVTDSIVVPCGTTTVTGSNFQAGSTVDIVFEGEVIGTATVGSDGTFSTTVTIPCDAPLGPNVLGISGVDEAGNPATVQVAITVVAAAGAGGGGAADTGADVAGGIVLMAALFGLGVVAIVVTRRRRAATPAA